MGQKLQDGKKVLCVSLNSPHSERPPGQTPGLSNLPFWILGNHYGASTHKIFHLPGTIFKGLKFKGKIMKNMVIFLKINILTRQFCNNSTEVAVEYITQKAIFLWLLGP